MTSHSSTQVPPTPKQEAHQRRSLVEVRTKLAEYRSIKDQMEAEQQQQQQQLPPPPPGIKVTLNIALRALGFKLMCTVLALHHG
jgi:hypothetical protein